MYPEEWKVKIMIVVIDQVKAKQLVAKHNKERTKSTNNGASSTEKKKRK